MNIAQQLPEPLNSFVLDVPANDYYDFELGPNSTYPLKGVTYPVDYGHIVGYTTEDKHELDLFVGNKVDGESGSIIVDRGTETPRERKFYVALTKQELEIILGELKPVLVSHNPLENVELLLRAVEFYKDKDADR